MSLGATAVNEFIFVSLIQDKNLPWLTYNIRNIKQLLWFWIL